MSGKPGFFCRLATPADLPRINEIYNHFVLHSTCTYQEDPETPAARRAWFDAHGPEYPITVAEVDGAVVGWGALTRFRERSAYRFSVENSVYVDHARHKSGIGTVLLADLVDRARALGYRVIVAGIDADQPASVALHAKFGFVHAGRLSNVGFKFGRWLDVIYMTKTF